MFLLDTDVISQRTKLKPNPAVMAWLSKTAHTDLWISAVSVEEIRYGIEMLDPGKRRNEIERWLEQDILVRFADRILPVDSAVANRCGSIIAAAVKERHNPDLADALIAATALVHGLKVATLNRRHFEKLPVDLVSY